MKEEQIKQIIDLYADIYTRMEKHPAIGKDKFTSADVERLTYTVWNETHKPQWQKEKDAGKNAPNGAVKKITGEVEEYKKQTKGKDGSPFKNPLFKVTIEGETYSTFDKNAFPKQMVSVGDNVELTLKKNGDFFNIVKCVLVDPPEEEEEGNEGEEE
jgi:hypothetical protein